ncbi:uncharacterized protein LOC129905264 [Episyrphus balteatus]|uniref:uncharacterized protein LOC129905264 n=1 Tax=Episyrphus balteatus TaxID=286459 RepID=UPI002486B6E2|nr:uncharacterized protein LOC129905264 [Episyrphus balteatus]
METSQNLNSEENISYCHITPQIKIEKTFDEEDSQQQYENSTFDETTTNNDFFIQKYDSESITNNSEQNYDFFQTNNDNNYNDNYKNDETIQMEHPLLSILSGEEYNIDINTHTATKLQTICNQIQYHQELNLTTQILFDGKFFTLKARDGNSLIGTCMICTPNRDITGASYSNFKAHLLRNHGQFMITKLNKHIRSSKTRLGAIERANSASSFDEIYQNLSPTYKAIFDGTFFTLISKNDKKLVASCQLCQTPTQIRGTLRSSANFQAHIQRIHGYSVVRQLKEHLRKSRKVQSYERKQSARHERDSKEHLNMNRSDSSFEELNDSLLLEPSEDNKDDILLKESLTHNQIDIHNYYNENEARKAMYKSLSLTYQILFDGRYFILKWKTSSYNRKIYCSICLLCKRQIKGQHLRNFRTHIGHFHGTAILEQFNKHINLETSRLEIDNVVSKEMEKSLLLSLLNNDDEKFDTSFPWSVDDDTEQDGPSSSSSNNLNNLLKDLALIYQILFDGKFFKLKSIKPYAKYNKKLLTATCKICRRDINGQHIIHFRRHLEFKHGEWVMDKLNEHIDREKLRLEPKIEENDEIQTSSLPTSTTTTTTTTTKSTSAKTSLLKKLNPDLQTLFDGKYFTDLRVRQSGNKVGTCKVCKPHADVKGNAVAHFRAHLKRKHGDEMVDEVNKYILSKNPRSESKNDESSEIQTNLLTSTTSSSTTSINRQTRVLNYFLKPSIPLSAVNSSEFWTMLNWFDTKMPRITQEELVDQIEMKFNNWKSKIIEILEGVDFVCTTIDLWSKRTQYNLAITCHWIDVETFKRRSVALAWKCFDTSPDGCNTDVLYKETLNNFNLSSDKIVSNVTKNCYNFTQIFKDLNINTKIKVDTINENHTVQTKDLLPSPYNCYTETLSCIATIDVPKVIDSNSSLKKINELTLKKVFSFLSLASTCPNLSGMLTNLKKPDITKWNTIFNSISCVLKLEEKSSFTELFKMVKLEPFTDEEVKYLREYVKCLSPLAMAFERLQCEKGTYQGFVLPTLLEMRKKCVKLQEGNDLTVCQSILETILDASMKRFEIYFKPNPESECLTIASLSHPFFKEKWVSAIDNLERTNVRELFINAVKCENSKLNQAEEENIQETVKCEQEIDEFYFGEEKPKVNTKSKLSIEVEALRYLDDERRDLKMLDDYPTVKRVFLKYNTGLSSSEPFEKLFPIETRENIARYDILADELIEERVLLSVNKDELVL